MEHPQVWQNMSMTPTTYPHIGIFVDNAMALIPKPTWTNQTLKQYFATAMKDAVSYGLTSIHDAGTYPDHIQFYKQ